MPGRIDLLLAAYRRERLHRRLFTWALRLCSLGLAGLYLYYLIGLGRDDIFYLWLTLGSIVSGLSGLVVIAYYELPQLVRDLHDPTLGDDAWAAIDALRGELLPRLFTDIGAAPEPGIDRAGLVRLTAPRLDNPWRRLAPLYLVVFLALLVGLLVLVVGHEPEILR